MPVYALGNVAPNVRQAAQAAGSAFGIATIYGVGFRDGVSDHPKGLALDFMTGGNPSKGDSVSNYFFQNNAMYGVTYIIWKQHIWNVTRASEGWRLMPDRGSTTANHFDHVHVSFKRLTGVNGTPTTPPNASGVIGVPNPVTGLVDIGKFFVFITDPHNWLRLGMFVLGFSLIIIALIMIVASGKQGLANAAKTVTKGVKNV
jgi:hypothetical protein